MTQAIKPLIEVVRETLRKLESKIDSFGVNPIGPASGSEAAAKLGQMQLWLHKLVGKIGSVAAKP